MSTCDYIHTMMDYNYALYRRLWGSIDELSEEQFVQEFEYSHGSVRNQLVHVANTDQRWLRGLKEIPGARQFTLNPADYPDRRSVHTLWDETSQQVLGFANALDEAGMLRQPQGMFGPVWQVLAHLANHGTDHRSQILRVLHDLGATTFDQDLIIYLWMG